MYRYAFATESLQAHQSQGYVREHNALRKLCGSAFLEFERDLAASFVRSDLLDETYLHLKLTELISACMILLSLCYSCGLKRTLTLHFFLAGKRKRAATATPTVMQAPTVAPPAQCEEALGLAPEQQAQAAAKAETPDVPVMFPSTASLYYEATAERTQYRTQKEVRVSACAMCVRV